MSSQIVDPQLDSILNPRSVAIVGVSREPNTYSYAELSIIKNYGYKGELYVVNPNAESILGYKCYRSIREIPTAVDLAIVMTSRKFVKDTVADCIQRRVKGVVIFTAGFGETSEDGRRDQEEIVELAKRSGVRIIGPNCLGVFSARANFDGTMAGYTPKGKIGLVLQSGNLIRSIVFPNRRRGAGFSHIVSLGNQSDVQFHECVSYLRNDKETEAIALYIEGLREGRAFIREVMETVKVKPVLVLKVGRSEVGTRAAVSHTASLAGSDKLYDDVFRQCGAIRVDWPSELATLSHALITHKLPKGKRMGVLAEGGGDSVVVADNCEGFGLEVPLLSERKQRNILALSKALVNVGNPVDYGTGVLPSEIPTVVPRIAEIMLEGDELDGLLLVGGYGGYGFWYEPFHKYGEEGAITLINFLRRCDKPVVFSSLYSVESARQYDMMKDAGMQIYVTHEEAVKCMATLASYSANRQRVANCEFESQLGTGSSANFFAGQEKVVLEPEAKRILGEYGISSPSFRVAGNEEEAIRSAEELGYPIVLKIVSPDIIHKSDVGGVKVGLMNHDQVGQAYKEIMDNVAALGSGPRISGIFVSKMGGPGLEVIIGGLNNPTFGPVVMFGLGGVFVEVLKDIAFRVAPFGRREAEEMITSLRATRILQGYRSREGFGFQPIVDALLNVSKLLIENPEIQELDINPASLQKGQILALDARILLR